MGHFKVHWSDCLEKLAAAMFARSADRLDPFETECTVVGSPLMAGWLKQYFLYDLPREQKRQRVLACWDFQLLHPFVNDWLAKASTGTPVGGRAPAEHPYAAGVLPWRIWGELAREDPPADYANLIAYIGNDPNAKARKRWGLAKRLARLLDDYQNYRPDLLCEWEAGRDTGLDESLRWQAALWRRLVNEQPGTYLRQFLHMRETLGSCGIQDTYRRITVFHVSAMPKAYMTFFATLGQMMPVDMFIFNPGKEFWIEDGTVRQHLKALIQNGDTLAWLDPPHPLLSGFARGTQAFLATILDVTDGNIHDHMWGNDKHGTLLQEIQADIRNQGAANSIAAGDDGSIQFHICHGPMREVEVVRDLIHKWFAENPGAEPRDVQVLVPDMETYAPFIESIFQVTEPTAPFPCSISKRPAVSAGAVGAAFVRLMQFNESRMSAPEAMEILELEPVRQRYDLEPDEVAEMRALVHAANIRWGRDATHINQTLSTNQEQGARNLPDTVTWRRGLDRLIAGFALGRCEEGDDVIQAGNLGSLRVHDATEGSTAELVGKLALFYDDLCETADGIARQDIRKISEWARFYAAMLERHFLGTESTFVDLAEIRRGIQAVAQAAAGAGDPEVPAEIVAAAIEAQLGDMAPTGKSDVNTVLFSPMRTMQVTPRKLIMILGLNEGAFPRADQRPAFDLLAIKPRYGDRSLRYEDRLAFIEAIMSACERLVITYTGRNIANNKEIPPSPAVTEFQQYLDTFAKGSKQTLVPPVHHRLHGFNPAYYSTAAEKKLFSYSRSNHAAAKILANPRKPAATATEPPDTQAGLALAQAITRAAAPTELPRHISIEELQAFFANPARHFYTQVLQVQLPDPECDNAWDSEIFDNNALDAYKINTIMLKDLLALPDSRTAAAFEPDADYGNRLQELALVPLGTFGHSAMRQRLLGLQDFLLAPADNGTHANLHEALRELQRARESPVAISITAGHFIITARLPVIRDPAAIPARDLLLQFRYASINAKDRIHAWLAHLVGHAASNTFTTRIISKDKTATIEPMDKAAAEATLAAILEAYDLGQRALLPFAPAASYAYAAEIARTADAREAAEKAGDAWDGFSFPECNDAYLFAAWDRKGPLAHPGFSATSQAFWQGYPFQVPTPRKGKPAAAAGNPEVQHA
jgi:exodeoxyribonuclease V gamma subunit